nr:venom protein U-MPTX.5-22 [Megalopyge opercularis]
MKLIIVLLVVASVILGLVSGAVKHESSLTESTLKGSAG